MLHTTHGIVFRTVKYSETSIIARIYTEQFGLQSYIVRGLRNKRSNLKTALFQPFNLVEIVVYHREKRELQSIKEIRLAYQFTSIPFDIRKSTVLIFLGEVINQVIREEEANPGLFNFLFDAVRKFDELEKNIASFLPVFLIQLTRFLGFFPKNNYSEETPHFGLMEGAFCKTTGPEKAIARKPFGSYIYSLCNANIGEKTDPPVKVNDRRKLLDYILYYYRHHMPGFKEIKSHGILQEVLSA